MRIVFLGLWLAASCGVSARELQPATVRGTVYVDADGNGRRGAGESIVPGAKLCNGRDLVRTDAQGRYAIEVRPGDTLFLVKPPEASAPHPLWRHHFPLGSPPLAFGGVAPTQLREVDFPLGIGPSRIPSRLDVLLFGDPQVKSTQDVDWYARDIVSPLVANPGARLGLSLGDIVDDDLSLYAAIDRATARLALPWLHLPGNHDLDFDAARDEDSLLTWRAHYGPDSYAWEEPEASFVLLDDVVWQPPPAPAPGYIGGLREDQFSFLSTYLATLDRTRLLVVAAHIPFHDATPGQATFRAADRERLFALLRPFRRVLLLSAHAHAQRHHFHAAAEGWHGAEPLHEYVVGTASGGFWSGLPDAQGIPDARMTDGTPNGYARLRIEDGDYRLRWHAARDPADTRIGLHVPRVLRRGAYPAAVVSANVYMGMADTRVEYRIDAGEWRPMQRSSAPDPALLALNAADDAAPRLRSFDRAVEATPSTHQWRGALPTDLAVGEHRVEVRAFDRWDGEQRATTHYRLEEYAPL